MGSVFSQLLDTLPFHLALGGIERRSHRRFTQASANDARNFIRKWPNSGQQSQPSPSAPQQGRTPQQIVTDKLWSWRHPASGTLARVDQVDCRVRDHAYQAYRVFDAIEWGYASGSNIRPFVRIETMGPQSNSIDLPLTSRFLHSRWHLRGGIVGPRSHWLWPLEATLDSGMVMAFAYEFSGPGESREPQPYAMSRDPTSEAAIAELAGGSASANWGNRVLQGGFMPTRVARTRPSVQTGGSADALAIIPRVIVCVSFATLTERPDFDPGGIAGTAKVFPQIMVKANFALNSVDGAVKMTRPTRTTPTVGGRGSREGHQHCHGEREGDGTITPLIVSDANSSGLPGSGSIQYASATPYWSELFAHYEDRYSHIGHSVRAVRTDRPRRRTRRNYGTRDITGLPTDATTLSKVARQGEFDNIHLAPRMRLNATHYMIDLRAMQIATGLSAAAFAATAAGVGMLVAGPLGAAVAALAAGGLMVGGREAVASLGPHTSIDNRSEWHLDQVKMAPFCSHDCLHTHWRWGHDLSGNANYVYGWSSDGANSRPHQIKGAPMVQPNHDVYLNVSSEHEMIYRVHAGPNGAGGQTTVLGHGPVAHIPSFSWQVINHHGSAYVSGIADRNMYYRVTLGAVTLERTVRLYNGSQELTPGGSMAAFYWHLRFTYGFTSTTTVGVQERVTLSDAQRRRARRL